MQCIPGFFLVVACTMPKLSKTILSTLIKGTLEPLWSGEGFGKSPVCHTSCFVQYHRLRQDQYQLIDVQRDKWWTKQCGKFAINLGVYIPKLMEITGRPIIEGVPPGGNWPISERLGVLATGRDVWWEIRETTDTQQLGDELTALWHKFASPWFEKLDDPKTLREWAIDQGDVALCVLLGERDEARRIFARGLLTRWGLAEERLKLPKDWGLLDEAAAARIEEVWHWPTEAYNEGIRREFPNELQDRK
jgi:hypothetical protein